MAEPKRRRVAAAGVADDAATKARIEALLAERFKRDRPRPAAAEAV